MRFAERGFRAAFDALPDDEHRRVRAFVTTHLADVARPIPAQEISDEMKLPVDRVKDILARLERRKAFLVCNQRGDVTWVYPLTVDPTPHQVRIDDGPELWAA